jgi:hypothetical protein
MLTKAGMCLSILAELLNTKFHGNPFRCSRVVTRGQMDNVAKRRAYFWQVSVPVRRNEDGGQLDTQPNTRLPILRTEVKDFLYIQMAIRS